MQKSTVKSRVLRPSSFTSRLRKHLNRKKARKKKKRELGFFLPMQCRSFYIHISTIKADAVAEDRKKTRVLEGTVDWRGKCTCIYSCTTEASEFPERRLRKGRVSYIRGRDLGWWNWRFCPRIADWGRSKWREKSKNSRTRKKKIYSWTFNAQMGILKRKLNITTLLFLFHDK